MDKVDYGIDDLIDTPFWNLIEEHPLINGDNFQWDDGPSSIDHWEDGVASSLEGRQDVHKYRADTRMPDEIIPSEESSQRYDVRKSKIAWLTDDDLMQQLSASVNLYNKKNWNYDLIGCDALQYGIYHEGDHYDWHVDEEAETPNVQGEFYMRKLSMTIWLNDPDEYEGGELDIELKGPHKNLRYNTLKLSKGSIVIFRSRLWHRVRPVTAGVRKSLVTWFRGPPFR